MEILSVKRSRVLLQILVILCILTLSTESKKKKGGKGRKQKEEFAVKAGAAYVISQLFIGYEQRNAPSFVKATEVQIGVYVNDFFAISERRMDYQLSIYLRQAWLDERLAYRHLDASMNKLVLDAESVNNMWVPDTFMRNEKRADYHMITVPNQLIRVNSTGHVWWVKKISATLSCPMNLKNYPMDTQYCPMMFESFGYTADTMYFSWLPTPVTIDGSVELPQFTLEDKQTYDCSQNYTAGLFPCLKIVFVLRRDLGFFLIQIYTPCILIVIISWVGFWINPAAVPARVTLGLVTVLTMTTQLTGANAAMPKVSYIKAMDVWLSTCLLFVFASLIEYSIVNYMMRLPPKTPKRKRQENSIEMNSMHEEEKEDEKPPGPLVRLCPAVLTNRKKKPDDYNKEIVVSLRPAEKEVEVTPITGPQRANHVEEVSRKLFPTAYGIFCAVYWIYFMYYASDGDEEA